MDSAALIIPPRSFKGSEAEWRARVDLAACYRLADLNHMSKVIWNHITARVPDEPDSILVFALGMRYDEVTASNLLKFDLSGKMASAGSEPISAAINFTAYTIHGPMYRARPDVMAVMHTHTRGGQGVAALKCGLLPVSQEALLAYGDVSYHEYEGLSDDEAESERLASDLGATNHMVLHNHGLITVGTTMAECYWRMYVMDRACQLQMDVLATGQELLLPSEEICARVRQQRAQWRPGRYEWPALLRLLDKRAPDYKT